MFLHRSGAEVVAAESAAQGVELLEQQPPDVIIADIGMPDQDGYTFMRRVRSRPECEGTAARDRTDRVCAQRGPRTRAGCGISASHVEVPADPSAVLASVAEFVSPRQ